MKSQRTTPTEPRTDRPSAEYLRLAGLPRAELEATLLRGETPDPDALAGWEFRGMNTPAFARLAGIRKFVKGFYRNAAGQLYGYNMPVVQNRDDEPWEHKLPLSTRRFGFYRVDPVDAATRDNAYLHALLLDYGRGGGSELVPTTRLRDYLVRVGPTFHDGTGDLYLGKAFVAVGPARIPVSYFVLERLRATDFRR